MTRARRQRILLIPRAVFAAIVLLAAGGSAPLGREAEAADTGAFCSINPPPEFSAQRTRGIVLRAEVVVRATALGPAPAPSAELAHVAGSAATVLPC